MSNTPPLTIELTLVMFTFDKYKEANYIKNTPPDKEDTFEIIVSKIPTLDCKAILTIPP